MPRDDLKTIFSQDDENLPAWKVAAQQARQNGTNQSQNAKQAQNYAPPVEVDGGLNGNNNFSFERAQETNALIKQNLENGENAPRENTFRSTNVRYYDEKLKNNDMSAYDAYLAKKFLGINVADYGDMTADINLNAKVKGLGLTSSHDKMYSDIDDGNSVDRLIMSSENNLGVKANFARWLHNATNGLTPTSQREFMANEENAAKSIARTNSGGGKVPVQIAKDTKEMIKAGNRSEQEYLEQMLAVKKQMLSSKEQTIRNNIAKGVKIPQVVAQSYENDLKKVAYMEDALKKDKFNYKEYSKYLFDSAAQVGSSGILDSNTEKNSVVRRVERKKQNEK